MARPDYTWNEGRQCWEKNVRKADGKYTKLRSYGKGSLSELRRMVRDFEIEQERCAVQHTGSTFGEVAEKWFSIASAGKRPNTVREMRYHLDKRILPVIGNIEIEKLKPSDIDELIVRWKDAKIDTARKTLSQVKRIIEYAQENGMNVVSVPKSKKAIGVQPERKEALTRDQQEKLLETVRGKASDLFVRLCLFAGLRESEACGLLWEDVHLDGGYPYISVCHTIDASLKITSIMKTKAANRVIPIPAALADSLMQAERRGSTVISSRSGSPISGETAMNALRQLKGIRELGFKVYPHLLRHTYISELCAASAETGLDIKTIQTLAGHASPQITMQIYAHVMRDRQEDTARKIQNVFRER